MGAITLRQLVSGAERRLSPSLGQGEARAMVGIIMESLKGYRPVDVVMHAGDEVTPWLESQVDGIIGRVLDGEPLQYVLGVARFMGNDYAVTPDTLIPRPETAEMVDMVAGRNGGRTDLRVLDIGTGSGCIAISLARALNLPRSMLWTSARPRWRWPPKMPAGLRPESGSSRWTSCRRRRHQPQYMI